ncbi:MAG: hypothetical protein Fur0023_06100 [Bacteroidia bacterium]
MPSSFNPKLQSKHLEYKIVAALERISEVLKRLLWDAATDYRLTPIQIQILIFLYYHIKDKSKPLYLSEEFQISKASLSDTLKILEQKKLIQKKQDAADQRSYYILLTNKGKQTVEKIISFEKPLLDVIASDLSQIEKEYFADILIKIIYQLYQKNIIQIQRMCFTCKYFDNKKKEYFCNLLNKSLRNTEIRIDCPEYEKISNQ